jgi:TRAP-type C4-dicarboxylate transport system permease small subunit
LSARPAWSFDRAVASISTAAAWIGGATFLLLCFYITIDVLGRRYGGPYSGVTDEISGYVLAIGGTLGLAHAMRIGAHVRIDLLLPRFSAATRYFLNLTNAATIAMFAILLAWYGWASTFYSFEIDARSITVLRTPLIIPQGLMALSFTLLALQSVAVVLEGLLKVRALGSAAWAGSAPGPDAEEIHGV